MALLVIKAAKPIIRISSKSLSFSPHGVKKAFSTSSSKKSYEDLFAWVAADVRAHSRYTSLLARLCITGPELGSHLPSEAENKIESQSARNCLPRMLEKLSRKDLMDLLLCFLANNPEVVKVLFVGGAETAFTKTKLQISFPKMINTIADECDAEWWYMHSRFRLKSSKPPGLLHVFVNVSDMEKETLGVFFMYDLLVVIGKLTTRSRYENRDEKGENHLNLIKKLYKAFGLKQQPTGEQVIMSRFTVPSEKYDLNQATGEIMEDGDELKISYPVVLEDVETPFCMHVQLIDKQMHNN